jgi:hypothetical protein
MRGEIDRHRSATEMTQSCRKLSVRFMLNRDERMACHACLAC